ncbi:MAG TPA: hypothetical protein DEO87_05425 [Lachnospiraceae bacterium]|nr:hypothetical protein [Lachnospiraceae bacterium]
MKKAAAKIKKYNTGTYIIGISVFALIAILIVIIDFNRLFTKPENLNKRVKNGFKPAAGEYVSIDIRQKDIKYGYAEADYKLYGVIPSGREYYYIIQLSNGGYISVSVRKKMAAKFDSLRKNGGETIVLKGVLEKMNTEIQDYYSRTLSAYGIGDEGGVTIYNLTVDSTDSLFSAWLLIGISIVFALFFTLMLVRSIRFKKENKDGAVEQDDAEEDE